MERQKSKEKLPKAEIVWKNVVIMALIHIGGLTGIFLWLTNQLKVGTWLLAFLWGYMSSFGVITGAHRLWAHRCYKAKLPLRIVLCAFHTVACQNSLWEWCRDHRVHHKYSETNADPHNSNRGFFFAHVGWLLCKKHEDVKTKGKTVDLSDLEADPVVMFQKRHFGKLTILGCFVIPTLIPYYCFNEKFIYAWYAVLGRYIIGLNFTWLVNSAAHLWGPRPYDGRINSVENMIVSILTGGEGWHNYHHVFPWDYKASEMGFYKYNFGTAFIDLMAWLGLAYDLKSVPEKVVLQRVARTGDGTHYKMGTKEGSQLIKEMRYKSINNNNEMDVSSVATDYY